MSQNTKNGTIIMRVMCAIFFLFFTFVYLYDYQADILAATQHVLSHGVTHYNRLVGALLITLVLWLVQLGVFALTHLTRLAHALTYLPSLLLLAILTDVSSKIEQGCFLGNWVWAFPLLIVIYARVVWVCRQLEPLEQPINIYGPFSRMVWVNLLTMVVMTFLVCLIGNSDRQFHYRMHIENDIIRKDYADALRVDDDDARTDSSLTMLRVWCLSETHQLGERLFEYPLTGHSDAMLPNGRSVVLVMADSMKLYSHLGVYFRQKMRPRHYLEKLHEKGWATSAAHDWLLTAYLLDGDLDAFVRSLPHFYNIKSSLPKHYREALILYNHLREHPAIVYHSTVMDADFEDYRSMMRKYPDARERYTMLRDTYGKTYWFYYQYCR